MLKNPLSVVRAMAYIGWSDKEMSLEERRVIECQGDRLAAWSEADPTPFARFVDYVFLVDSPMPSPVKSKSRVFPSGGAWLLEDNSSDRSLAGVLYNHKTDNGDHTRKQAEKIHR